MKKELVAIDLCAGAGGWACAARGLPIRMMLAVDLDPWALRTYQFNHPGTFCVQADVMEFDFRPLAGKVDLILAGIPEDLEGRTFWRSISWREGARLQGFPEDYVFIGSQTKAEKLIAQAVQVDTGRAILRAICRQAGVVAA